jgi:hypothetical protein
VGDPIYPVLAAHNYKGRSALFFGTRDAGGAPKSLYQSVHWDGSTTNQATRILYDSAGYPAQLIDDTTGAFLALFWNTTGGTVDVQSYSSGAVYQGGIRVTIVAGAVTTVAPLSSEPTRAVSLEPLTTTRVRSLDELKTQQQVVALMAGPLLLLFLSATTGTTLLTPALLTLLALSAAKMQRLGRALELWYTLLLPALAAGTLPIIALALETGRGYGKLEDYFSYSLFLVIYRFYTYNAVRHLYLSSG